MRKPFVSPEIEIINLQMESVIAASAGGQTDPWETDPNPNNARRYPNNVDIWGEEDDEDTDF